MVETCLFQYEKSGRGFSLPEQILLYACILHLIHQVDDFDRKIRVIRNLVSNSENELRIMTMGKGLKEIYDFMITGNMDVFEYFKKDQIQEEKDKKDFLAHEPSQTEVIYRLEDHALFRGCISIFDLDNTLESCSKSFISTFREESSAEDWRTLANVLFCFGDFTQDDGDLTNVLSGRQSDWRKFFTTPGYNKQHFFNKTKPVLIACLNYFESNLDEFPDTKIQNTLLKYQEQGKDWKYYFLKYPLFRQNCNQGYCSWYSGNDYLLYKMKERQFNGYHWDPFLESIKKIVSDDRIELNNYGGKLNITLGTSLLSLSSTETGFRLSGLNDEPLDQFIFSKLLDEGLVTETGQLFIKQDELGNDLDDRVQKGCDLVTGILRITVENK